VALADPPRRRRYHTISAARTLSVEDEFGYLLFKLIQAAIDVSIGSDTAVAATANCESPAVNES
jgi:hypothetical protein